MYITVRSVTEKLDIKLHVAIRLCLTASSGIKMEGTCLDSEIVFVIKKKIDFWFTVDKKSF